MPSYYIKCLTYLHTYLQYIHVLIVYWVYINGFDVMWNAAKCCWTIHIYSLTIMFYSLQFIKLNKNLLLLRLITNSDVYFMSFIHFSAPSNIRHCYLFSSTTTYLSFSLLDRSVLGSNFTVVSSSTLKQNKSNNTSRKLILAEKEQQTEEIFIFLF